MIRTGSGNAHPIPWRLNFAIVAIQLAVFAAFLYLCRATPFGWWTAALAAGFAVLMNSVYSTIHEAEHAILFPDRRWNDGVGIAMAMLFPAPFHLLRQGHIGHHLRNRSDDEAFDLYFEGESVVWRWMVWLGILTGLYYVMVVVANPLLAVWPSVLDRRKSKVEEAVPLDRHSVAWLAAFNTNHLLWIRLEAIATMALHASIIVFLGVSWFTYLVLYAAFGFTWSAMQYVHHYDTERHVTRGTRNLRLFGWLDKLLLNHNWHRAHHEHPTVPWIYLPAVTKTEQGEMGDQRDFLPGHYLRMWRGPKQATEHVENKFAGRIIQ
ncbi:MAG: fatty acid desaturase [Phycisphaerales bacterium]